MCQIRFWLLPHLDCAKASQGDQMANINKTASIELVKSRHSLPISTNGEPDLSFFMWILEIIRVCGRFK